MASTPPSSRRHVRTRTRPHPPEEPPADEHDLALHKLVGLDETGRPLQEPPSPCTDEDRIAALEERELRRWLRRPWPRSRPGGGVFSQRFHSFRAFYITTYRRCEAPGRGWCFAIRDELNERDWLADEWGFDSEKDAKAAAFFELLDLLAKSLGGGS